MQRRRACAFISCCISLPFCPIAPFLAKTNSYLPSGHVFNIIMPESRSEVFFTDPDPDVNTAHFLYPSSLTPTPCYLISHPPPSSLISPPPSLNPPSHTSSTCIIPLLLPHLSIPQPSPSHLIFLYHPSPLLLSHLSSPSLNPPHHTSSFIRHRFILLPHPSSSLTPCPNHFPLIPHPTSLIHPLPKNLLLFWKNISK